MPFGIPPGASGDTSRPSTSDTIKAEGRSRIGSFLRGLLGGKRPTACPIEHDFVPHDWRGVMRDIARAEGLSISDATLARLWIDSYIPTCQAGERSVCGGPRACTVSQMGQVRNLSRAAAVAAVRSWAERNSTGGELPAGADPNPPADVPTWTPGTPYIPGPPAASTVRPASAAAGVGIAVLAIAALAAK